MKCGLTWVRMLILLMFLAVGYWIAKMNQGERTPKAKPLGVFQTSTLKFIPDKVRFKNVLPGTLHGDINLFNPSGNTIRDISLYPSCGCQRIKHEHIDEIAPGASINIPFDFDVFSVGYIEELITAYIGSSRSAADARIEIWANALPPFIGLKGSWITIPTFSRLDPSHPSEPRVIHLKTASSISALTLKPSVGWLHITGRKNKRNYIFTLTVDKSVPDGEYETEVEADYTAEGKKGSTNLYFAGKVHSQLKVDPAIISFGVVHLNRVGVPVFCKIYFNKLLEGNISVNCPNHLIRASIQKQEHRMMIIQAKLSPKQLGEIDSNLVLLNKGKIVLTIPVSAFVMQ